MKEVTLKLANPDGLHARPAGVFVKVASGFRSQIDIKAKGQTKNAKSIMSLLSLGLEKDDVIQIIAQGEDEDMAVQSLESLIRNQFSSAMA